MEGFEPPTSCSQSKRATGLRYTPRRRELYREFARSSNVFATRVSKNGDKTTFSRTGEHPAEYRWSSYQTTAQGEGSILIQPHAVYDAPGADAKYRQAAYRELFCNELEPGSAMKYDRQGVETMRRETRFLPSRLAQQQDTGLYQERRDAHTSRRNRNREYHFSEKTCPVAVPFSPFVMSRSHSFCYHLIAFLLIVLLSACSESETPFRADAENVGAALIPVYLGPDSTRKCAYLNAKGEFVIEPTLDICTDFAANGLAVVKKDGKYGFINTQGKFVIAPKLEGALNFAANGLALALKNGKRGFINTQGEFVIAPTLEAAMSFADNGLALALKNGKYGFINAQGEFVIAPEFEIVDDFAANGLAAAMENGKYGYINTQGEFVIAPRFEYAGIFAINGLARVKEKEETGYINIHGEYVITPRLRDAGDFAANGLAPVKTERGAWGYINAEGEFVIAPDVNPYEIFHAGFHANRFKGDGWACTYGLCINAKGESAPEPIGTSGLSRIVKNGRTEYLNAQQELVFFEESDSSVCYMRILNNATGKTLWPHQNNITRICDEAKTKERIKQNLWWWDHL